MRSIPHRHSLSALTLKQAQRIVAHWGRRLWLLAKAVCKTRLDWRHAVGRYTALYSGTGAGVLSWRPMCLLRHCQRARPDQPAAAQAELISWPCDNVVFSRGRLEAIDAASWRRRCAPFHRCPSRSAQPPNQTTTNCRQAAMVVVWTTGISCKDSDAEFSLVICSTTPASSDNCRFCDSSRSSSTRTE